MESIDVPQHIETQLDDLKFFSNFDSGNLIRVVKSGPASYELYIAADAQNRGFNHYRTWFHFGIQGLKKKTFIKLSIMNLSHLRVFASPHYRPVFKSLPSFPEWKQIPGDCTYEHNFANFYKISWIFSSDFDAQTVYFAFAAPYTFGEITNSIDIFEESVPTRTYFHREVLIKSPDRRNVELITIGHETCFSKDREPKLPNLFPNSKLRPLKSKVPVVVITSRVHPGETPASYLLEAILRAILQPSKLMEALRRQCVFKIIPCLNPDGVFRGHYRADQFGVNLNRCYISPTYIDHPTIYATKNYIEYLHFTENQLWMYLDLHAHISKRGCFLFGNALDSVRQIENQLLAKLLSLNSTYVDYGECDFREKSMMRKDPKDPISKEGSGRVAIYRSTNITHSYTIECCYHCPRSLHNISNLVNLKSGKRVAESLFSPDLDFAPMVYNKMMYEEIGIGMMLSVLDMKSNIVFSRIPSCEFRTVDAIKDWLKDKIQTQMRIKYKMNRTNSRVEFTKRHQIARISRKLDESVNQSFVTPTCSDKKLQNRLILQARAQKMIEDIGLNLMTSKSNE